MHHLHTVFIVGSSPTATTNLALVSLVVEVLFCNQGVEVRFLPGAPILSRIRLAAMPPRLGRGVRRFESFMRDHLQSISSEVEHHVDIVTVTGSIPVGTTKHATLADVVIAAV